MPELIFESLTAANSHDQSAWFTYLGYQTAVRHESNGREGETSRSLNTVYIQPLLAIGPLNNWHLILAPEVFAYIGGLSDNRGLADYRGYGQLRAVLARNKGPSLMLTAIPGRGFHKHTLQWDLTVPVHVPVIDWRTYLLFQYFDGYGESLLHYNQKVRLFRAGVSFVR
jgi:outer membrane phospholipase A